MEFLVKTREAPPAPRPQHSQYDTRTISYPPALTKYTTLLLQFKQSRDLKLGFPHPRVSAVITRLLVILGEDFLKNFEGLNFVPFQSKKIPKSQVSHPPVLRV
ncbi:hypothetical protein KIL84_009900 [Mauremys mutica]|uniref:Uncharacterized protein n=1 Tax=Mauremys mutica TaxID=74926 RepID=A0A9D4B677_9SAUR|nr:hypothetical protein KIL84_009900 [Mauremys mutica]